MQRVEPPEGGTRCRCVEAKSQGYLALMQIPTATSGISQAT